MTILALFLKASLVLSAAALALAVFRRSASAAWRHWVGTLTVLGLLVLPPLSIMLPRWTAVEVTTAAIPAAPPIANERDASSSAVGDAVPSAVTIPAQRPAAIATDEGFPWSTALTLVYGMGVLFFLLRVLAEHVWVRQLVHLSTPVTEQAWRGLLAECGGGIGVRRPVRLLRSQEQSIPIAVGNWQCAIVLPATAETWSDDRRRAVLLHELAHVGRRDCLTQLLTAIACALYWPHPGVWWIAHRLRLDAEHACDDRVLSAGTSAQDYAEHLIELAYTIGRNGPSRLGACMAAPGELPRRVLAILDDARNRTQLTVRPRIAALAAMSVLVIPVSAASLTSIPTAPADVRIDEAVTSGVEEGDHASDRFERLAPAFAPEPPVSRPQPVQARQPALPPSSRPAGRGAMLAWTERSGLRFELRFQGAVTLADDDRDVAAISPGGFLHVTLSDRDAADIVRVELAAPEGQPLVRRFWSAGVERPWQPEGRAWWSESLPRIVRRSGFEAEQRIDRILDSDGPLAVLDEIDHLETDSVRGRYFRGLFSQRPLGEGLRDAFFTRLASLRSDNEHRRVLETIAEGTSDTTVLAAAVRSTADMESSREIASVLATVAGRHQLAGPIREVYREAANRIPSNQERSRALLALGEGAGRAR